MRASVAQRVGLADQRFDHRVRALVRRAEHDEARAVARHQLIPELSIFVNQRAHDQTAHAMREEPDRPHGIFRVVERVCVKIPPGDRPEYRAADASRKGTVRLGASP